MLISSKTPKSRVLELGKPCERSNHCCKYSSGFLAEDDLGNIAQFLKISKEELRREYLREVEIFNTKALRPRLIKEDKPYGRCIFLDENGCKINPVKPLQCKVSTCKQYGYDLVQWFYVNYLVDKNDPESIRQYAQFLKFNKPIPGATLEELVPDKDKLRKILNYEIK